MKSRSILLCARILPLIVAAALSAQETLAKDPLAPGKYSIDPAHSKVGFEVAHLVISTVEGRFEKFSGDFDIAEKITDSKINASIEAASIATGNSDRDNHLRGADFFDVKKYPKLTFVSKEITGSPGSFKMKGDLTIRGITKPVTFEGQYLGTAKDAWGNIKAAFSAKTKINRKDFGLTWNKLVEVGPTVGDEVTLDLRIQAAKAK